MKHSRMLTDSRRSKAELTYSRANQPKLSQPSSLAWHSLPLSRLVGTILLAHTQPLSSSTIHALDKYNASHVKA